MQFSAHTFVNSPFIKLSSNGTPGADHGLLAKPGSHPNGVKTPTLAEVCASQRSPALNPTTDLLPQASLQHLFTGTTWPLWTSVLITAVLEWGSDF